MRVAKPDQTVPTRMHARDTCPDFTRDLLVLGAGGDKTVRVPRAARLAVRISPLLLSAPPSSDFPLPLTCFRMASRASSSLALARWCPLRGPSQVVPFIGYVNRVLIDEWSGRGTHRPLHPLRLPSPASEAARR